MSGDQPESELSSNLEECIDILGNGLVVKKVLKQGLGSGSCPTHGDSVVISYRGWVEDGTVVDQAEHFHMVLGDGECIHAFHLALPLAECKEEFELKTHSRFAFGDLGRLPEIPGKAALTYHITLEQCNDPPCYEKLHIDERFSISDRKRERGNYYFGREEFQFALTSYTKAIEILTMPSNSESIRPDENFPPCTPEEVLQLDIKLRNNIAACQLKLEAYQAAIKTCDDVLQADPDNSKALFRKGKALVGTGDLAEAIILYEKLVTILPNSTQAKSELARARAAWKAQRERQVRALGRALKTQKSMESKSKLAGVRNLCYRYRVALGALLIAGVSVIIGSVAMRFTEPSSV